MSQFRQNSQNQLYGSSSSQFVLRPANSDERWMKAAIALGQRNVGITWPNPSVGCIIVREQDVAPIVVGRGTTAIGGRPHAEVVALEQAGGAAEGATAYVTLEPCSHFGKTEPCVHSLIQAGIRRVVIGLIDPDPRISGKGVKCLQEASIEVRSGVLKHDCLQLHIGHVSRMTKNRPHVKLKMAVSKDGYIGRVGTGQVTISSNQSRQLAHTLRSDSDGIAVGIGTVLADNPELTCRIPGLINRSPVRIILDSHARMPVDCSLVSSAGKVPVYCMVADTAPAERCDELKRAGVLVEVLPPDESGRVPLELVMAKLTDIGLTTVMVEGGASLAESLLKSNLIDEVIFVFGQREIGPNGVRPLNDIPLDWLEMSGRFSLLGTRKLGVDEVVRYERKGSC